MILKWLKNFVVRFQIEFATTGGAILLFWEKCHADLFTANAVHWLCVILNTVCDKIPNRVRNNGGFGFFHFGKMPHGF